MSEPTRLDILKLYIGRLAKDQGKAGKFAGKGENRIHAAVDAILNGSESMATQLWEDLKAIGAEKAALAAPLAEAIVTQAAADGAKAAIAWAGGQLKDLIAGKPTKAARRDMGKQLMRFGRK
jgi:hypothetical protein